VDYDPEAWSRVEAEGLGGFTGITPVRSLNLSPSGLPVMADAAGRAKFIGQSPMAHNAFAVHTDY